MSARHPTKPLESRQLVLFVTLARSLSMSHAARELNLTPSGVSHGLKALEDELGCRLLNRSPQNMELTREGQHFLPEAEAILQRMGEARAKMQSSQEWKGSELRVAASSTACQYILPPVLREFRDSLTDCTVKIHVAETQRAADLLAQRSIDLALTLQPEHISESRFIPLGEEQLKIIVNPLHPWALRPNFRRADIMEQKLIFPEHTSETYRVIERYFHSEKLRIRPFIEIENEEAIKQFVRLDLGIGILPSWIARDEVEQGLLCALPIGRRKLSRRMGILRGHSRLNFAENLFVGICRNVVRDLISGR
ncbi:MAG TPA: LysR family transcriptional regulator [Chthoniobacteraceae bacterium]|jgi:DNA-binding transcriptional LysR family regulator|nr:LysR family transcriptional regulator [Chthoniobacteraceae bacterium]